MGIVVDAYAIHHPTVSFRCLREEDTSGGGAGKKRSAKAADGGAGGRADFNRKTPGGAFTTQRDVIRYLEGEELASHLLPVSFDSKSDQAGNKLSVSIKLHGVVSDCSYSRKKRECVLFINNRLVECTKLKQRVHAAYL